MLKLVGHKLHIRHFHTTQIFTIHEIPLAIDELAVSGFLLPKMNQTACETSASLDMVKRRSHMVSRCHHLAWTNCTTLACNICGVGEL